MTHPKKVKLFEPWAKAMVAGATVDKPDYGKKTKQSAKSTHRKSRRRRRKRSARKKKMKHG